MMVGSAGCHIRRIQICHHRSGPRHVGSASITAMLWVQGNVPPSIPPCMATTYGSALVDNPQHQVHKLSFIHWILHALLYKTRSLIPEAWIWLSRFYKVLLVLHRALEVLIKTELARSGSLEDTGKIKHGMYHTDITKVTKVTNNIKNTMTSSHVALRRHVDPLNHRREREPSQG